MPPPRKKLEADILEEWIAKQRFQREAPRPLKGRMPKVTPMQSSRQRRALRQTADPVRASYNSEHPMNATPVRPNEEGLTRNLEADPDYRAGKATETRSPDPAKKKQRRRTTRVKVTNPDVAVTTVDDLQAWIDARS